MPVARHKRFRRDDSFPPFCLTERDTEIIRLLKNYRFLRSSHITSLLDGSHQQLLRRLQKLYHHGYIERPLSQLDYFVHGGSRRIIYGLGNRGAAYLDRIDNSARKRYECGYYNSRASRLFLDHALMVSDILIKLCLAVRCHLRVEFSPFLRRNNQRSLDWRIRLHGAEEVRVIPDAAFVLDLSSRNRNDRVLCLLEADRGTMPLVSSNPNRSSIHRKFAAYQASFDANVFRKRFGFHRVQVLTITNSAERFQTMTQLLSTVARTPALFVLGEYSEVTGDPLNFLNQVTDRLLQGSPAPFSKRNGPDFG